MKLLSAFLSQKMTKIFVCSNSPWFLASLVAMSHIPLTEKLDQDDPVKPCHNTDNFTSNFQCKGKKPQLLAFVKNGLFEKWTFPYIGQRVNCLVHLKYKSIPPCLFKFPVKFFVWGFLFPGAYLKHIFTREFAAGDARRCRNTHGEVLRHWRWLQCNGHGASRAKPGGSLQLLQQEDEP